MKQTKLGSHVIRFYDNIEDLPIVRYQKFNKLSMIDAGVGSSISDFDLHLQRMAKYVERGETDNYNKEVSNIRQSLFFILNEVSPKHRAFAALVEEIDGEKVTDLSDSGLEYITSKLGDVKALELDSIIEEVKKKLNSECKSYFPNIFDESGSKEYYSRLRAWTLLTLEKIQEKNPEKCDELSKKIHILADELLLFSPPKDFTGRDSAEVEFDKSFDSTCMFIAQHLHLNPREFSVLQFYNALEFVQETQKREQKAIRRRH